MARAKKSQEPKPKKPKPKKLTMAEISEKLQSIATAVAERRPTEALGTVLSVVPGEILVHRSPLVIVADVAMDLEKVRVAAQVRTTHLARRGQRCPKTEQIFHLGEIFEYIVDEMLAEEVRVHPAAPWFNRVKGTGGELIGKVLGHIERFGRFYDVGDPMIPPYVTREPDMVPVLSGEDSEVLDEKPMIWVSGIERLVKPSALRKYACLIPDAKRESGQKAPGNYELRTALFRLGTSMMRSQGKFAEFYYDYKGRIVRREEAKGTKIMPTPKGRFCPACDKEMKVKKARFCPDCGGPLANKEEPPGVLFEGHLHMRAMHRMMQLFLDLLWVEWRTAEKLPLREPYPIEYLGHTTVITPEMLCDRPSKEKKAG
ncbi:MAG: hypothetical protein Q7S52_05745 [bacterium]|nr:hypothetical protein [bacterium]